MSKISIQKVFNSPISSNCYLIYNKDSTSCILVDPGTYDNTNHLSHFLKANNLNLNYVILTHEHFDHIAGVISLQEKYQFELCCSKNTEVALTDPKRNLSAFNDQMNPVIINHEPTVLGGNEELILLGTKFHFLLTPGHSPGSLCFLFEQNFFSGDTLLNQQKARLNLPGSDKNQYKLSMQKINQFLKPGMTVYPGHGEPFIYNFNS